MADLPADMQPNVIRPLLTGSVGRDLRVLAEVGSTNDVVMEAGQQGEPEGLAVLADRQMRGRGRAGRSWTSPPGVGIYTSILLRPRLRPAECARIPLLVGLAVADGTVGEKLDVALKSGCGNCVNPLIGACDRP